MSDNNINVTAPLHAATKQGKLTAAREVFMDGDKETLQQIGDKTHQLENAVKDITATGGASTANAVSYNNETSGMTAVTAQGAIDELATKNKSYDAEISKKANSADVTSQMQTEQTRVNKELGKKANKEDMDTELGKKFNKSSIAQESGEAEDKVMSQKAVSNKLSDLSNKTQFYDCSNDNATFESLEEAITSVPDAIKKGNLTISFLSKDNELHKFTLNCNSWSDDATLWIEQQYLENSESVLFKIADILGISPFTILKDGVVNIPLLKSRTITKLTQMIKSLTELVNSNSTQVSAELDKKVDKEEGKSLADNDIIDSISLKAFKSIFAMIDSNDVVVLKIDEKGKLIPCSQELIDIQKSPYLYTIVDSDNHILFAIKKDGSFVPRLLKEEDLNKINSAFSTLDSRIKVLEERQKIVKNIVCFGDSLTAGAGGQGTTYESVMQAELGDSYKVINCGVGGEQVYPITARQGGIVSFLANEVSIPMDKTEVEIGTKTDSGVHCLKLDGTEVALPLLLQGHGNSVNPCYIDDIPCTLRWYGSSYADTNGKYFLKSNIELSKVHKVVTKSPIYFYGNTLRNSHALVIWMGQNGGFKTVDELKELYKKAISHSGCSNYVIIGLHGYNKTIEEDLEKQFKQEFGNHFIDWRNYLLTRALDDANITPTEQDLADINNGLCPTSLRYDNVHLNATGYTLLAKQILNRFKYLGVI